MAQPGSSTTRSSMSVHPSGRKSQSSAGRGRGRGSSSGGNQNRIYALAGRQDHESSPDVVIGILTIFSHDANVLIDPGSTLSYIIPFVAGKFACYATLDCRGKAARFHFPGEIVLEWVDNTVTPRDRFISYLKVRKMIAKWCIYHIVRVRDTDAELPTLHSIPVIKKYADVFLDELP
ncbi:uncharacterized protein [Nicotiana tomentosiformis]|uniref:uncharacterized protein n=1 Tax=Nicotiana tomentosiformis TaxID=4098 RepID=UPI00388C8832